MNMETQLVSQLKDACDGFIKSKIKEIISQEIEKANKEVTRRIEEESLKIALKMAQYYRIDSIADGITISVIKR